MLSFIWGWGANLFLGVGGRSNYIPGKQLTTGMIFKHCSRDLGGLFIPQDTFVERFDYFRAF